MFKRPLEGSNIEQDPKKAKLNDFDSKCIINIISREIKLDIGKLFNILITKDRCPYNQELLELAIERDIVELVQLIYEKNDELFKTEKDLYQLAFKNGSIKFLKCLKQNGITLPKNIAYCNTAAENGHLECLKFAHQNGCFWDKDTCKAAAGGGHLECLQYAHQNGCPWNQATCYYAAYGGHLECLQYAHQNGCQLNELVCEYAAENGHLKCLQYARQNGCPWDLETCDKAAYEGHLDCLQYAHQNGCPWDKCTLINCAFGGNLECLKYAHQNECPMEDSETLDGCCEMAASEGHIECLKYAYQNGFPFNKKNCIESVKFGHKNYLEDLSKNDKDEFKCLIENNSNIDEIKDYYKPQKYFLKCLEYINQISCPSNETTCSSASDKGI